MSYKSFSDYIKEGTNEITFAFGRFNPPTVGHEKLMNAVKKLARGGTYRIYPSQSQDAKKNPLDFKLKVKFMRKMFPKHARNIMADKGMRTAFDVIVALYDQGYTHVSFVAGEDRVIEFEKLLNKYNGSKGRHGFYQFENGIIVKKGHNKKNITSFIDKIKKVENIVECHHITGSGDFILRVVAKNIESYQELMLDKVTEIEVTDSLQSMVILSTFKDNKVVPV